MRLVRWLSVLAAMGMGAVPAIHAQVPDRSGVQRRPSPLERVLNERLSQLRIGAAEFRASHGNAPRHPTLAELCEPGVVVDRVPANPINGSTEIRAAMWDSADPPVTGTAGWNYDEQAGRVWPDCRVTERAVPFDESLALDEYRRRGMPSPDRPWTGETALEAARALKALRPGELPRLESARSGTLFGRLFAPENLDACRDARRPLEDRLADACHHMTANGDLLDAYAKAFAAAGVGDYEPLAIQFQALRTAALIADLSDEVLSDTSGGPRAAARRRQELDPAYAGLEALVAKNFDMLVYMESSPAERRRWIVEQMANWIPMIVVHLPERGRLRVSARIRSIESAELQPALGDLVAAVDAAVAARAAGEKSAE